MKNYPANYLYVHILGEVGDILPDQSHTYFNGYAIKEFYGVVVYTHGFDRKGYEPNLGTWGEDGSWDGAFLNDNNTIIEEYTGEA